MRIRRKPGRATDLASSETRRRYGLAASGSEAGGGIAISPLTERCGIPSNAASASGTAEGRNPALLGSPPNVFKDGFDVPRDGIRIDCVRHRTNDACGMLTDDLDMPPILHHSPFIIHHSS